MSSRRTRRIGSFVDAVVTDRRPRHFKSGPTDASLLRVAIAISACSPKDRTPDDTFIEYLRNELNVQVHGTDRPRARLAVRGRTRLVLGAVTALSTLGGATVVATTSLEHALAAVPAAQSSYSGVLRTATFKSEHGKTV